MFRDNRSTEPSTSGWQTIQSDIAVIAPRAQALEIAPANDEIGAVWHVYREIARRIPRNAYTRHPATLGGTLR